MLKACGIIAEYNPFHLGHLYQMKQALKKSNSNVLIICLSGNFVERGEPSLINKWEKTKLALLNGADIVIELPTAFAVEPADLFAKGAIKLLSDIGCSSLSFGSELYNFNYSKFGHELNNLKISSNDFCNYRKTYATQLNEVYQSKLGISISYPNHLLGLSYAKINDQLQQPMKLIPILRKGAMHDQQFIKNNKLASSSAIRNMILNNFSFDQLKNVVPTNTLNILLNSNLMTWDKLFYLLKYKILISNVNELHKIYQMSEGIEFKIKKVISKANSFNELLVMLKSKRYTYTRLRRLLMYILLDIKDRDVKYAYNNPYIRILGFSKRGRQWLNFYKKKINIPIITNLNMKDVKKILSLQIKVDSLITFITGKEQNFGHIPIMI